MKSYVKVSLILSLGMALAASSCQERMICPAYQSTFILDDSVREEKFSLFADSLPKPFDGVDKSRYGIIVKKSKNEKYRAMQTIAMKDILPPKQEPDSSLIPERSIEELNRMRDELNRPALEKEQAN